MAYKCIFLVQKSPYSYKNSARDNLVPIVCLLGMTSLINLRTGILQDRMRDAINELVPSLQFAQKSAQVSSVYCLKSVLSMFSTWPVPYQNEIENCAD